MNGAQAVPVVRRPSMNQVYIQRAIDIGAMGIVVPMVKTAEEARAVVAATVGDLALIAAAQRPVSHAAVTEPLLFHRVADAIRATTAYPIEEYADHLRARAGEHDALLRTTALFDPIAHAPGIRAQVLIRAADEAGMGGRAWFGDLFDALGDRAKTVTVTHRGGPDGDAIDAWLSAALRAPARPRSWTVAS